MLKPTIPGLRRDPYAGTYMGPIRLPHNGEVAKIVGKGVHKVFFANWLKTNFDV